MSNDSDPLFTGEFYRNLKILSQDLFKRSTTAAGAAGRVSASTPLDRRKEAERGAGVHSNDYFSAGSIHDRIKQYAKGGNIPTDYLERYMQDGNNVKHSSADTE